MNKRSAPQSPRPAGGFFSTWFRAMRIPFLEASILPVLVGSALAYHAGNFSWGLLGLMVLAMAAINIGANLSNDYFDHRSGADERNHHPTPFSGGSRVIQEKLVPPERMLRVALAAYAAAILLGLYLASQTGRGLLWFGAAGILLSFFYTAPPLKLGYRGWGEPLVGILLGPVAVMGAYYVYTLKLTPQAFWVSLPIGFLVTGILYINQFPDAEPDAAAGKRHWVARIGRKRAVGGYLAILTAAYLSILLPIAMGVLPAWTLLALVTAPFAVRAARIVRRSPDQLRELLPAMGLTAGTHLSVGLLLLAGLLLDAWIGR